MILFEVGMNGVHVREGLRWGHTGLEMSENLENSMGGSPFIQYRSGVHLCLIDDRHVEIGRTEYQRSDKTWRCYTDDRERAPVQADDSTDNGAIVVETAVPIRIAQNEIGGAVGAMFIGAVKEAAEMRLNFEDVEVVAAHGIAGRDGRLVASGGESDEGEVEGGEVFKGAVAVAQIDIVGIRLPSRALAVLGSEKSLGLWHIK